MSKSTSLLLALCVLSLGCFVAGMLFPEAWWATHHAAFLPPAVGFGLLGGAVAIFALFAFSPVGDRLIDRVPEGPPWLTPLVVAAISTGIFVAFPITHDIYGDAAQWKKEYGNAFFPEAELWRQVLSPAIFTGRTGVYTVLAGTCLVRQTAGISLADAFLWVDAVCGFLYVFATLGFLRWYIADRRWRLVLGTIVVTSPALQNFAGHIELYAPALLAISLAVMVQLAWLRTHRRLFLILLIPATLLAIKVHFTSTLLLLSVGLTLAHAALRHREFWSRRLRWRSVAVWILAPVFLAGAFVYFVVLEDHVDPRIQNFDLIEERMFLPLFSPEPPLDRYNLLGFNHLFDYFQLTLTWSAGGMLLLAALLLCLRRNVAWNSPPVLVAGISLVLYAGFFFVANPFMSMPIDFDLFCLPAPLLTLFLAAATGSMQTTESDARPPAPLLGAILGLGLLYVPIVAVNASRGPLADRLEAVGIHIFKTYWMHATDVIVASHDLVDRPGSTRSMERMRGVIEKLEPFAVPGKDGLFGFLAIRLARNYRAARMYPQALAYYQKSYDYQSESDDDLGDVVECLYILERYAEAHDVARKLIVEVLDPETDARQKSKPQTVYRIALICALEAGRYPAAAKHCEQLLALTPRDDAIRQVLADLRAKRDLDELKFRFRPRGVPPIAAPRSGR